MGIWQVCAVSSILKSMVFSVHPQLNNPFERFDLHRLILPQPQSIRGQKAAFRCDDDQATPQNTLIIMWTTRRDMTKEHWIANHIVLAVPKATDSVREQVRRSDEIFDVPPPEECHGLWVQLRYDRKPYPGVVVQVDGNKDRGLCQLHECCWQGFYQHFRLSQNIPGPLAVCMIMTKSCPSSQSQFTKTMHETIFSVDKAMWRAVVTKLKA